jgi:hypothetical protein
MMFSKNALFILIAIYFIFTYPFTIRTWNLNEAIGWHSTIGRPWQTYLIPLWFILIFFTYQKLSTKGIIIKNIFFWLHVLLTMIPTVIINYPFVKSNYSLDTTIEDPIGKIFRINLYVKLYFVAQVSLYAFLLFKLFKNATK